MGHLSSLNKYFARYKKKLFLGILFIFISNIASVYIPLLIKDTVNDLQSNQNLTELPKYALLIVGAAIVSGFFRFLIRETIIVVSREIEYDIRQDFWSHIQKLPLRFFQNNSTGNIMAHATNDISAVRMYVGPAVMYSIDTISTFLIVIGIMLTLDPLLTVYTLVPLPLMSFFVYKLSKKIHKKFTKIQEKFSDLTTKAQESFSGIRVIKSYVRENNQIESFTKMSDDYLERNMDKVKIQALFQPLLYLIAGISIIVVIWFGGTKVIAGTMTLGEIFAFTMYLGFLIWPMIAFGWVANIVQQASASNKRLNKILHEKFEITDSEKTNFSIEELKGKVEFRNVSFRYGDHLPYVLKNINIEIPQGSTVAIIGHTGVGKSTLVNLIPRLYDIEEGEIRIDGHNVRDIPISVLRKNIGIVPQETFLFSETLYSNILYGLPDGEGGMQLVESVADISQLTKDVESFPKKYDTILGERGITLSGGQKQRSTLSRALVINPKILILDDSFSAVDTNTEEEILKRLKEFMKNRTSIIISHRISTVKDADKIFVLDKGEVIEEGTHNELVELDGIYADLHYKQLLEQELKELK